MLQLWRYGVTFGAGAEPGGGWMRKERGQKGMLSSLHLHVLYCMYNTETGGCVLLNELGTYTVCGWV